MNDIASISNGRDRTLDDILLIEQDSDIMVPACSTTGVSVWPQVRVWLIRKIMADWLYAGAGRPDVPTRPTPLRTAVTMARSIAHNQYMRRSGRARADVLVTTEAMADQLTQGRWFNRMADPFADLAEVRTLVLIDQHEWEWHSPRCNPDIFLHAPLQAATSIAARTSVSSKQRRQAKELASFVAGRASSLLDWQMGENCKRSFAAYIARKLATSAPRLRAYEKLLKAVRPKIIVNSSGCYGHIGTMMAAGNDAGIVTAEYQHGAVSEGHDAYNFAPALHSDERLLRVLPRYFLSYGAWWNERFNAPVHKIAIGYPERARKLARLGELSPARRTILILSDGVEFDLYLDMARTIAAAVRNRGLEVAIRPHPMERTQVTRRWRDEAGGPHLDLATDIYESFAQAHTVISDMSTGLFEAIGLVEQVIMLDSPKARFTYPNHPFAVARTPDEVISLINGKGHVTPQIAPEALWQPAWRDGYLGFLRDMKVL